MNPAPVPGPVPQDPEPLEAFGINRDLLNWLSKIADPGVRDRILTLVEAEAAHRRSVQVTAREAWARAVAEQSASTRRGQVFGLIIGLASIAGATLSGVFGTGGAGATGAGACEVGILSIGVASFLSRARRSVDRPPPAS